MRPPRAFTSSTHAWIICCCCLGSTPVVLTPWRPVFPRSSMRNPTFTDVAVTPTSLAVSAGAELACCTDPPPLDGAAPAPPPAAVVTGPEAVGADAPGAAPVATVVDGSPATLVTDPAPAVPAAGGAAPADNRDDGAAPCVTGVPKARGTSNPATSMPATTPTSAVATWLRLRIDLGARPTR